MITGQGKRFDKEKLRFDLVPSFPQEQYAKVLTMGAKKYGDRNWEHGMAWSRVLGSLKRHIHAFECGEDHDKESGLLHMAHVMTNAAFLLEYYNSYPQGDDRVLPYHKTPKIGLDIDEVLADFVGSYTARYGPQSVESWDFDPNIRERLQELKEDREFWMNIKPKIKPSEIPFEPHCYITSRVCPTEWTVEWLHKNGFPMSPVYTTDKKALKAKEVGVDWFIDDRYSNFVDMNSQGVCCFLYDAPHNQRYYVGYRRVDSLQGLPLFQQSSN